MGFLFNASLLILLSIVTTSSQTLSECNWCKLLEFYPNHYNSMKLSSNETITIDGYLNGSSWMNVEFTNNSFVDIAISLYNSSINGYNIPSNNYSTKVKLRWDDEYLYIGAVLKEPFVYGTVRGHNNAPVVPYFDHDFEIFIDPSGTNYFYKEIEINVLNATYDVLHHKTNPIPCNSSSYGNNTVWCLDTSWNNHGNWTMYSPDNGGLTSKTSIQYTPINNTNVCISPCNKCPVLTPKAWCPWSYLSMSNEDCNEWPQLMQYVSWTVEIALPFQNSNQYRHSNVSHGGLLDTDNITLDNEFISKYNPNSWNNLGEHKLYWFIDFARTEHPLGYNDSSIWSVVTNETILEEVFNEYPTLLGVNKWNNYWEWTWQSIGITKYTHYPEFYGMIQFINDPSQICLNIEWPGRYLIYSLWWANYEYFLYHNGTKYATDIDELLLETYCKSDYCDLNALMNATYSTDSCFKFEIVIDSYHGCVNFLSYNNMTLYQKLYSGICYHSTVYIKVDNQSNYNDYSVTLTESHQLSVSRKNYNGCLK